MEPTTFKKTEKPLQNKSGNQGGKTLLKEGFTDEERKELQYAVSIENIYPSVKKMTDKELITRTLQAEEDIQKKRLLSQFDLEKESQLW